MKCKYLQEYNKYNFKQTLSAFNILKLKWDGEK